MDPNVIHTIDTRIAALLFYNPLRVPITSLRLKMALPASSRQRHFWGASVLTTAAASPRPSLRVLDARPERWTHPGGRTFASPALQRPLLSPSLNALDARHRVVAFSLPQRNASVSTARLAQGAGMPLLDSAHEEQCPLASSPGMAACSRYRPAAGSRQWQCQK